MDIDVLASLGLNIDLAFSTVLKAPFLGDPTRESLCHELVSLVCDNGQAKLPRHRDAVQQYLEQEACNLGAAPEIVLLRGPPGLGKSTFALSELLQLQTSTGKRKQEATAHDHRERKLAERLVHICSTDDFFTNISEDLSEQYVFERKDIGVHHKRNHKRVKFLMDIGVSPLYVDNTNMTWWEMKDYVKLADRSSYQVRIIEPHVFHPQWDQIDFLHARNEARRASGKEIDVEVLERMISKFEPLPLDASDDWLTLIRSAER